MSEVESRHKSSFIRPEEPNFENSSHKQRLLALSENLLTKYTAEPVGEDGGASAGAVKNILRYQFSPGTDTKEPFPAGYKNSKYRLDWLSSVIGVAEMCKGVLRPQDGVVAGLLNSFLIRGQNGSVRDYIRDQATITAADIAFADRVLRTIIAYLKKQFKKN